MRPDLAYQIDGIVIKCDSIEIQKLLGHTSKLPRWACAYKFPAQKAETEVKAIDIQVGRTGAITPVAKLLPIMVDGAVISNVSLHNFSELARKDVRVGDWVVIQRAGDVIPEIVSVVKEKRKPNCIAFKQPSHCPSCRTALVRPDDQIVWRCPNSTSCPEQVKGMIRHFVSRHAMNIDGLGERIIVQLITAGLVKDISDLYALQFSQLQAMPRFASNSAHNLIASLHASKQTTLARLLYALGIREVGVQTAKLLAKHYTSWQALAKATEEDLSKLPDIGPIAAQSLVSYFQSEAHIDILEKLDAYGICPKVEQTEVIVDGPLVNKKIVITGKFSRSRSEISAILQNLGAEMLTSVTKNTDICIVGEDAGSKKKKAENLGLEVWSSEDLSLFLQENKK